MSEKKFLILVINPGSTSTKIAVFENDQALCTESIAHKPTDFQGCASILDQLGVRMQYVLQMLAKNNLDINTLSAVVGRGGLITALASGTYLINEKMLKDLRKGSAETHASSLGGIIAAEIGKKQNIPAYVVDPVVVDEMEPYSKLSGVPGVERKSIFHALNSKAVARLAAVQFGKPYNDCRFVVAHMGGGITVSAHRYGRVIDSNNGLTGEGPFTPERCGCLPVESVINMCFSGEYSKEEMLAYCHKNGGLKAYLGTNDMRQVERMIMSGDEFAALVVEGMAYQVAKEIGAMVAALEGRLTGILLTGGLAYSQRLTGSIKQRVDQIAPVMTFPGEFEMSALALGALRVLTGQEKVAEY